MERMKGIITALLTPFDENGNIDKEALREHIYFLIEKGVHGLYVLGTTGEAFMLTTQERMQVVELVLEYTEGRIPVYVMVGNIPTEEACKLALHAKSAGASGIGAITPIYHAVTQTEIEQYYLAIANSVGEDYPVYLYNLPERSGSDILTDTVIKLSKTPNILGIKNSMSDMLRLCSLIDNTPDDFDVLQGCDPLILPAIVYGAKGAVSGISNVFPELFVKLYDTLMKGDYKKAIGLQKLCTKACNILQNGASLSYLKNGVYIRGIKKSYTRRPLLDITEKQLVELKENMEKILNNF